MSKLKEAIEKLDLPGTLVGLLFAAIKDISLKHKIIGVDVCGEPKNSEETCSEDVSINSKTNRLIQDFLLNLPGFE